MEHVLELGRVLTVTPAHPAGASDLGAAVRAVAAGVQEAFGRLYRDQHAARRRDAMPLWHPDPARQRCGARRRRRRARRPRADAVRRGAQGVMRLDRPALDSWWNALGLLDTTWWHTWKRPLQEVAPR
jgi:hypothetical protein